MKKIAAVICLGLAIFFAMGTIGCIDTDPAVSCFGAVCTVLLFLAWMKLRKKKKAATPTKAAPAKPSPAATTVKTAALAKPAETPAPALTMPAGPKYEHIHIKVAGVTFSNEDGTNRQQLLRKIKYGKAPFEDNDNLDVALKAQTFTNPDGIEEPAVGVYVNEYQIGFVPKDLIKDVMYALDQPTATITAIDISGGGTHEGITYPYGCKVVVRYEKQQIASESKSTAATATPPTRKNIDMTVYATQHGKCYHESSFCDLIKDKRTVAYKMSIAKRKGLVPCSKCYPYSYR